MNKRIIVNLSETEVLIEKIINNLKPGKILGLVGDLGAGKTTFVQILAKKLGIEDRVNSPTFNLQKLYNCRPTNLGIENLLHVDAYRLASLAELEDIGFFEYIGNGKTVAVVEWSNQLPELQDLQNYLEIKFVGIDNPEQREIEVPEKLLL